MKKYGAAIVVLTGLLLLFASFGGSCRKQDATVTTTPVLTPAEADDYLIVPGKRAGIFQLGESIEKLESRIGKGIIAPREDFQIYSFKDRMVDVCVQKDVVLMILIANPKYATKEGFRIGGSISPVIRTFGRKYEYEKGKGTEIDYIIQYWEFGIAFSVKHERIVKLKLFDQRLAIKQMKE